MSNKKFISIPIEISNGLSFLMGRKKFKELISETEEKVQQALFKDNCEGSDKEWFADIENSWDNVSSSDLNDISSFMQDIANGKIKTTPVS